MVFVHDLASGVQCGMFYEQENEVRTVSVSKDGDLVAFPMHDKTVRIGRARGGGAVHRVRTSKVSEVLAWSPTEDIVAIENEEKAQCIV